MNRNEMAQISNICSALYNQPGENVFLSGDAFFAAAVERGMEQRTALQIRLMLDSSNLGILLAQRSDAYEEYACAIALVVEEGGLRAERAAELINAMVHPLGLTIKVNGRPKKYMVPAGMNERASVRMRAVMQSQRPDLAFSETEADAPFLEEGYGWAEYYAAVLHEKTDPEASFALLEDAANQGFAPAIRKLGVMLFEQYRQSKGEKGDLQKAMDYLMMVDAGTDEAAREALEGLIKEKQVCRTRNRGLLCIWSIMTVLSLVATFFAEGALALTVFVVCDAILLRLLAFIILRVFGTMRNERWLIRLLLVLWAVECIFLLM